MERPFSLREKDRMRECKIGMLPGFDPLTPTLSRREREFMGQQCCWLNPCCMKKPP